MATLKQRLHRKNASGTFDTVHLETSSDLVVRASGGTIEDSLPQIISGDSVPETLSHGTILVTNDRVYIGDSNNQPMEVVTMAHELNIGTINGLTIEQILDKMVEKKIGIAGSGSSLIDDGIVVGDIELGKLVNMDGIIWRVVHIDNSAGEFILCKEIVSENIKFGDNNTYAGSTIAQKCSEFEQSLDVRVRNRLIPKTVHGVTNTVWIPQCNWISATKPNTTSVNNGKGLFDYFTDNSSRIALNDSGAAQYWWTSSPGSSGVVCYVAPGGSLNSYRPAGAIGFRPFVALPL